ncbi:MAG: hypothetical protein NVS4B2_30080 [Chloroflexota bacterium]
MSAHSIRRDTLRTTKKLTPAPAFPRTAGAFVMIVGCLVLAGWLLDRGIPKSLVPGLVAMNPATALTFIVAGISLWQLEATQRNRRAQRLGTVLAWFVTLVGLIKLFGIVTGWDLGIDQVLFHDQLAPAGSRLVNRMAPNTATAFLLMGLVLVSLFLEPRYDLRISQSFALGATVVSSLAFVGYIYGVPSLSGISSYIHMALNTALAFVVLSAGVLFARSRTGIVAVVTSDGPGGALARAQLPAAIVISIVLGWLRLKGQELRLYNTNAGVSIAAVYSMYLSALLIWLGARALDRLDTERRRVEIERAQLHSDRQELNQSGEEAHGE